MLNVIGKSTSNVKNLINSQMKLKIKLMSFDYKLIDASIQEIIRSVKKTGAQIKGPIVLPVKTSRMTLLKSPHIFKKARDQFDLKTHKRLIYIIDPNSGTVDELVKLVLSAGVDVSVKVVDKDK